ncbi:MAG TPA: helix-turn-helix domain-containing protein [Terrimesophilobacter sp.]|nr:helix-turn-helix domain-containing protein [Terrimesophilobacter sp.]HRP99149.1 helix-turn-helix domain-containing protein [Terrimesophilobacter sp.]
MIRQRPRRHYKALDSLSRINLLHDLQVNGSRTILELADATGLHPNTAREHLHRLIEAGLVRSETIPREGKGRPQLRYHAEHRAAAKYATRDANGRAHQLEVLDNHMDQCGFAQIELQDTTMVMHNCPFATLAVDHPQVCEVHFTLVKAALTSVDGPLRARELHRFTQPTVCEVEIDILDDAIEPELMSA